MSRFRLAAFALGCSIALFAGCGGSKEPAAQNTSGDSDALGKLRQKAAEQESINNLKQIGIALLNYHSVHRHLPSNKAVVDGASPRGWRIEILPMIEEQNLTGLPPKEIDKHMPRLFINPRFQKKEDKPNTTYYRCFLGEGTPLGSLANVNLETIANANGAVNTILVVEAGEPILWTSVDDLVLDPKKPLPPLGGPNREDFYALFADGTVRKLPVKIAEKNLRRALRFDNMTPFTLP